MKPIYQPKGAAREYGDYALNIYTGCPHRCYYCFAPNVLHRVKETFHTEVHPRDNIVEATRRQLEQEHIIGKRIHLCFTCDPYPVGYDTSVTREIIRILKEHGNSVQILTKGSGTRDFDLLDKSDHYGITLSCSETTAAFAEPNASTPISRINDLRLAKERCISTWVSFEPVLEPEAIYDYIKRYHDIFDLVKIGKLNYHTSNVNWANFAEGVKWHCMYYGVPFYIKESLRKEMRQFETS